MWGGGVIAILEIFNAFLNPLNRPNVTSWKNVGKNLKEGESWWSH